MDDEESRSRQRSGTSQSAPGEIVGKSNGGSRAQRCTACRHAVHGACNCSRRCMGSNAVHVKIVSARTAQKPAAGWHRKTLAARCHLPSMRVRRVATTHQVSFVTRTCDGHACGCGLQRITESSGTNPKINRRPSILNFRPEPLLTCAMTS